MPLAAVPPHISTISCVARRRPMGASAARIPRSNLSEASVRKSSAVRVRLVLTGLKLADSSRTVVVSGVISEFAPPITPARPTASLESAMVSMGGLSFRCSPSSVVSSLAFSGRPDDYCAVFARVEIEGVQRLAVLQHDIVGDVHDVVDGTLARPGQRVPQPLRR